MNIGDCFVFDASSLSFETETSFFFLTNSKNSATWRAYLQTSKMMKINYLMNIDLLIEVQKKIKARDERKSSLKFHDDP